MSAHAAEQFEKCVRRYSDDLEREVSRIEAGERATGVDQPEITSTMVLKADRFLRSDPADSVPRRSRVAVVLAGASGASTVGAATDRSLAQMA
jgi:hypothetical protein